MLLGIGSNVDYPSLLETLALCSSLHCLVTARRVTLTRTPTLGEHSLLDEESHLHFNEGW